MTFKIQTNGVIIFFFKSEDRLIDGVKVRIYKPNTQNVEPLPLILHFHGGGKSEFINFIDIENLIEI